MLTGKFLSILSALCVALYCEVAAAMPEKPKVVLAVGGKATLYYLPLTIAESRGYFRDEAVEVEINDFPGGSKALQALIGGSADVVSGAFEHTIVMLRWLQTATAEDIAGVVPPEYLLGDRELYLAAFRRLKSTYSTDGRIPAKGVANSYSVLRTHNTAVRRAPVIWLKDTYTNRFVENALKTYQ